MNTRLHIIRPIKDSEYEMIRDNIREYYFLPKYKWTKPLHEMAYDGLMSKKWRGIGAFDSNEKLLSYLDYKEHTESKVEIGIGMTQEEYRGCGLMGLMLRFLIARYPGCEIIVGTYEGNARMIRCLEHTGFVEDHRIFGDRVDGSTSIHYRYPMVCKMK